MEMALARNQAGVGFVVYQGKIDNSDFDGDLVTGGSLIGSRGDERERGNTQSQSGSNQKGRKHKYKYDIFEL